MIIYCSFKNMGNFVSCRALPKQSVRLLSCCLMMRDSVINVRPHASFLPWPAQTVPSAWSVSITLRICATAPLKNSTSGICQLLLLLFFACTCKYNCHKINTVVFFFSNTSTICVIFCYLFTLQVQVHPGWVISHVTSIKSSVGVLWFLGQQSKRGTWTGRRKQNRWGISINYIKPWNFSKT